MSEQLEDAFGQLVDDPEFHLLTERLDRFNLFDAVGGARTELRHSNFLAFLLSPRRSHGLGALPLERVLRAVVEDVPTDMRPIRTLELIVSDLDDALVYRERDNIDLLIELPSIKLVVLIENKIGASAGDGQLARYKEIVERDYGAWRRLLVFLTPDGTEPDCDGYVPFSYRRLAQVLEKLAADSESRQGPALILSHYVEMLRRHVVPDDDLRDLALRLYDKHRDAFDFVFDVKPKPRTLLDIVTADALSVEGLIADRPGANITRFLPSQWDGLPALRCGSNEWTGTGRGLLFEIKLNPATGRLWIVLMLGPCRADVRELLHAAALQNRSVFKGVSKSLYRIHTQLYSRELLSAALAQDLEYDPQVFNARLAWGAFQGEDLPALIAEVQRVIGGDESSEELSVPVEEAPA